MRKAGLDVKGARSASRPRLPSARSATASARSGGPASPRRWSAATRSWRPEDAHESVATSNEVLHADLANSQARSQGMAAKVDHICDRVDLLYDKEASN